MNLVTWLKNLIRKYTNVSPSGSRIFKHKNIFGTEELDAETVNQNSQMRLDNYISWFGNEYDSFEDTTNTTPVIKTYSFSPNSDREYRTLVTDGMSNLELTTPKDLQTFSKEEIVFLVKEKTYKLNPDSFVNAVRMYAKFPHMVKSFFYNGHTVESYLPGNSLFPTFDDKFKYILLLLALPINGMSEEVFNRLRIENKEVKFLYLIPITEFEFNLKMKKGLDALFDHWEESLGEIPLIFDHLR